MSTPSPKKPPRSGNLSDGNEFRTSVKRSNGSEFKRAPQPPAFIAKNNSSGQLKTMSDPKAQALRNTLAKRKGIS